MATQKKTFSDGGDKEIGVVESDSVTISIKDHTDIAHNLYKESLDMDPIERDIVAKRVLRKLDFIVLPMVGGQPLLC